MKNRRSWAYYALFVGTLSWMGCFGGSTNSNNLSGDGVFSSDALVQAIPYEILRNNLISSFGLNSSDEAIQILDDNRASFGASTSPGAPRNTSLSLSRLRTYSTICDSAARTAMQRIPDQFFDSGSLSPDKAYRKIMGRPINDEKRAAIDKLLAVEGYSSETQKKHAILFCICNQMESQIQ